MVLAGREDKRGKEERRETSVQRRRAKTSTFCLQCTQRTRVGEWGAPVGVREKRPNGLAESGVEMCALKT